MIKQLPLEFKLLDNFTFNSFFAGDNQQLILDLQNFIIPDRNPELFCYLFGRAQVGKTHLLQAACNYALNNNVNAMYLPMKNLIIQHPRDDYLTGLDQLHLLCIDDIEVITNNIELQKKIFHLFNNLRSNKGKLIITANTNPIQLPLELLDLKSRLSWGIAYTVAELNENDKIAALITRAAQIGLELKLEVAKFLLNRINRNLGELFATLQILDHASLAAKHKLTVPFVKRVLGV